MSLGGKAPKATGRFGSASFCRKMMSDELCNATWQKPDMCVACLPATSARELNEVTEGTGRPCYLGT